MFGSLTSVVPVQLIISRLNKNIIDFFMILVIDVLLKLVKKDKSLRVLKLQIENNL